MPNPPQNHTPLVTKITPYLFILLLATQVLDLHSTLRGISTRTETNQFINWLSTQMGFTQALVFAKAIAVIALFAFYKAWRKTKGQFDFPAALCLSGLLMVSLFVVINNYIS